MPTLQTDHDDWEPPGKFWDLLKNETLKQRDRIELVIAFYSAAHGGNAPTYQQMGDILGIGRANAFRFAMELLRPWEKRAEKKGGKLWLVDSEYSHPIVKQFLKQERLEKEQREDEEYFIEQE